MEHECDNAKKHMRLLATNTGLVFLDTFAIYYIADKTEPSLVGSVALFVLILLWGQCGKKCINNIKKIKEYRRNNINQKIK